MQQSDDAVGCLTAPAVGDEQQIQVDLLARHKRFTARGSKQGVVRPSFSARSLMYWQRAAWFIEGCGPALAGGLLVGSTS